MSRQINWIPSIESKNHQILNELQNKMKHFYATSNTYYEDIDFSSNVWNNAEFLPQQDIINDLTNYDRILEIGCGKANVLLNHEQFQSAYHGVDFSEQLMLTNREKYPKAHFHHISDPTCLPFPDHSFDYIFSHFVIEHTVYPNIFLDECLRLLKPGGMLVIVCPDFLDKNHMSSQRVGYSPGSGRVKLKNGKWWDAFVTGIDSKVRLPFICNSYRIKAKRKPQFYININPVCFSDPFQPDVDAVYVTYKEEIETYCKDQLNWVPGSAELLTYCREHRIIYLKGKKKLAKQKEYTGKNTG